MKFIDRTGFIYNRLTVVSLCSRGGDGCKWNCKCECGKDTIVRSTHLTTGQVKSCGCYNEVRIKNRTKHAEGITGKTTKEFRTWAAIKQRCYNKKDPAYQNYGGRGIRVCREWKKSYLSFLNHIGRAPSKDHSIDRIDNNKGYRPGNVRWATRIQQANNKRKTVYVDHEGNKVPVSLLARQLGVPRHSLLRR